MAEIATAGVPKTAKEWGKFHMDRVVAAEAQLRQANDDLRRFRNSCPHDQGVDEVPEIDGPGVGTGKYCTICSQRLD